MIKAMHLHCYLASGAEIKMKKDLLLLHGAIGSKDQFQKLSGLLYEHFTIHTLNFSGHGDATPSQKFSIEIFADEVLQYLETNKIESINIFGYSMGGYIALYLARFYSQRIDKVFTFATKFLWSPEIAAKEIKMLQPQIIKEKLPAFAEALNIRHHGNRETVLANTADMMKRMGEHNPLSLEDYNEIESMVLIGIGDQDNMVSLEETINVYRNLKNAGLLVIPQTPHPIEKIDITRLKNEILSFFN